MVRLSFGEILVILLVLLLAFGSRVQSERRLRGHAGGPAKRWSPTAVTVIFAILIGGGYAFFRAIGVILRMVKK